MERSRTRIDPYSSTAIGTRGLDRLLQIQPRQLQTSDAWEPFAYVRINSYRISFSRPFCFSFSCPHLVNLQLSSTAIWAPPCADCELEVSPHQDVQNVEKTSNVLLSHFEKKLVGKPADRWGQEINPSTQSFFKLGNTDTFSEDIPSHVK